MNRKEYLIVFVFFLLPYFSLAQINPIQFEQLDSLQKAEKKTIVVFLHTSWCKYCGVMKNSTFKNKEVVKLLADNFHFISLDIEEKRDIVFKGHLFRYKPTGNNTGVHELAEQLGTITGHLGYPSICILNAEYEILYQQEGFMPAKDFLFLLKSMKKSPSERN